MGLKGFFYCQPAGPAYSCSLLLQAKEETFFDTTQLSSAEAEPSTGYKTVSVVLFHLVLMEKIRILFPPHNSGAKNYAGADKWIISKGLSGASVAALATRIYDNITKY